MPSRALPPRLSGRTVNLLPMKESAVPPVRKSIKVATTPERAFRIFTSEMHRWLPSCEGDAHEREAIVLEPRAGGRWFERAKHGVEFDWGCIVSWDPPQRVILGWQ